MAKIRGVVLSVGGRGARVAPASQKVGARWARFRLGGLWPIFTEGGVAEAERTPADAPGGEGIKNTCRKRPGERASERGMKQPRERKAARNTKCGLASPRGAPPPGGGRGALFGGQVLSVFLELCQMWGS